jgi:heat shock protein HslJ
MQVFRRRGARWWAPSLALALVIVMLAAGCAPLAPLAPPPPPPDGVGGVQMGHLYASTSVTVNGRPTPLVAGTRIEMRFSPRPLALMASAGCSVMSGPFEGVDGRLLVQLQVTTYQVCDLPRLWQDLWLFIFLSSGPTMSMQGSQLRLQAGGTVVVLEDRTLHPDRTLSGTEWQLESIVGQPGTTPLPPGPAATLVFGGGSVEQDVSFTYCNDFRGPAQLGPGPYITIGALQRTSRPCEPGADEVEAAVVGVLSGTIVQEIQGDVLELTHPSGRGLVLRARSLAPPPPLEGTEWQLDSLDNGQPVPLPPGTGATLTVTPPTIQVQIADCNRGEANVQVDDTSLLVGDFRWTEMACQPGPAELEAYVGAVLRGSPLPGYTDRIVQFDIDAGGRLLLRNPDTYEGLVLSAP